MGLSLSSPPSPPQLGISTFNHCQKTSISVAPEEERGKIISEIAQEMGSGRLDSGKTALSEISREDKLSQHECPQKGSPRGPSRHGISLLPGQGSGDPALIHVEEKEKIQCNFYSNLLVFVKTYEEIRAGSLLLALRLSLS